MPEIDYGAHLIEYVFKFGDISYTEILSWCELTRTPLTAWEAETMIRIKSSYDSMKQKSEDKDIPAPYLSNEAQLIEQVNQQFDDLWGAAE